MRLLSTALVLSPTNDTGQQGQTVREKGRETRDGRLSESSVAHLIEEEVQNQTVALKGSGQLGCISPPAEREGGQSTRRLCLLSDSEKKKKRKKPSVTSALLATTAPAVLRLRVCHFKLVAEEGRRGGPCPGFAKTH